MTLHCSPARSRRTPSRWASWSQPTGLRAAENDWGIYPAVTVAILGEWETRWGLGPAVASLADLAVDDELLIVYGTERRRLGDCPVVARLREHLPRHHVIAVPIARYRYPDATLVEYFLENGSLPVVVTPAPAVHQVAAELASHLHADRVVRVSWTIDGIDVGQVWHRTAVTAGR